MKLSLVLLLAVSLFVFGSTTANAHPGNTASDGCHYCRTNCDKWGIPWNERHCHGETINTNTTTQQIAPSPEIQPTSTPIFEPTVRSTAKPTIEPTALTSTASATLVATLSPQSSPTNKPNFTAKAKIKRSSGFWGWLMSFFNR